MAAYAERPTQAAGSLPSSASAMSAEQSKFRQLSQMIAKLETSSVLQATDPDIVLPALQTLEQRLSGLKNRVAFSSNSQDPSSGDVDQLIIRTQRLSRQMERRQLALAAQSRREDSCFSFISTSAMGRFLEESIHSQTTARIVLPPAPKLILNEAPLPTTVDGETSSNGDVEKRRLAEEEAEAEGMAEYEQASQLRRRRGYADSAEGDDQTKEKGFQESQQKSPAAATTSPNTASSTVNQSTHENLSSELLRMAGLLKSQSISFSSALERDRKLLESTDDQLTKNLDFMTRTRGRLGEYAHKARGMGWLTFGTIVVVVITWIVMFLIIRLT